jgi:osmotically-inducible protein OsmY
MIQKISTIILTFSLVFLLSSCGILSVISVTKTVITTDLDRRTIGVIADDELANLELEAWAVDDKKLDNSHLNFTVYDKNILITGEVESAEIIQYVLQQVPKKVVTRRILNEMVIAQPTSLASRAKDSLIDGKIKIALNNQEVFNPVHINYHTENGVVYLLGDVTKREAKKAGHMVAGVGGVTKVIKYFNYIPNIPQREVERALAREQEKIKQEQLNLQHRDKGITFQ